MAGAEHGFKVHGFSDTWIRNQAFTVARIGKCAFKLFLTESVEYISEHGRVNIFSVVAKPLRITPLLFQLLNLLMLEICLNEAFLFPFNLK